jgi:UDP-N-acetylmuramate-alanine ligase
VHFDDAGVKDILSSIHRPLLTYGFSNGADIQAINISQSNRQMYFEVILTPQKQSFKVEFNGICACFLNFQKLPKFHLDGVHNHRIRVLDGY